MTTVAKLTPEQRAEIRSHAERGDLDAVMRHLDCDGVLELLDAGDQLAAMTDARDEACEIADRHIFAPNITVHAPPAAVQLQESWSATVDTGAVYRDKARVAELRKVGS